MFNLAIDGTFLHFLAEGMWIMTAGNGAAFHEINWLL